MLVASYEIFEGNFFDTNSQETEFAKHSADSFLRKAISVYNLEDNRAEKSDEDFSNLNFTKRFFNILENSTIRWIENENNYNKDYIKNGHISNPIHWAYISDNKDCNCSFLSEENQVVGLKVKGAIVPTPTYIDNWPKLYKIPHDITLMVDDYKEFEQESIVLSALLDGISQIENPKTILNDLGLLKKLFLNEVPEELKGVLEYQYEQKPDGTTKEVYQDIRTGDTYTFGTIPTVQAKTIYQIVDTEVGEYKFLSYFDNEGYIGSRYTFNNITTLESKFFDILENQRTLEED